MPDSTSDVESSTGGWDISRREVLHALGSGALSAAFARVFYEYTGFGHLTGTNLREQSLAPLVRSDLEATAFETTVGNRRVSFDGETVSVRTEAGTPLETAAVEGSAETLESVPEPGAETLRDLRAIGGGEYEVQFHRVDSFFDRVREADSRPLAVAALREEGFDGPDRATVEAFAGVDPAATAPLVRGLSDGFGDHTLFDAPRYAAQVLQKYSPLDGVRGQFAGPTGFEAIDEGRTGLYCYEYAVRTVEAFHAVPPQDQTDPVFGGLVIDTRHNHAYAALGSVVREDEGLLVRMTFLDYFYAALFDALGLRGLLGPGHGAYDRFHRATSVHYDNVYAWASSSGGE